MAIAFVKSDQANTDLRITAGQVCVEMKKASLTECKARLFYSKNALQLRRDKCGRFLFSVGVGRTAVFLLKRRVELAERRKADA